MLYFTIEFFFLWHCPIQFSFVFFIDATVTGYFTTLLYTYSLRIFSSHFILFKSTFPEVLMVHISVTHLCPDSERRISPLFHICRGSSYGPCLCYVLVSSGSRISPMWACMFHCSARRWVHFSVPLKYYSFDPIRLFTLLYSFILLFIFINFRYILIYLYIILAGPYFMGARRGNF